MIAYIIIYVWVICDVRWMRLERLHLTRAVQGATWLHYQNTWDQCTIQLYRTMSYAIHTCYLRQGLSLCLGAIAPLLLKHICEDMRMTAGYGILVISGHKTQAAYWAPLMLMRLVLMASHNVKLHSATSTCSEHIEICGRIFQVHL